MGHRETPKNETKLRALTTDKPTLKEKQVLVEREMSVEYKLVSGEEERYQLCCEWPMGMETEKTEDEGEKTKVTYFNLNE